MPLNYYIVLATILFSIGMFGVILRKNTIVMFMCIEMMLNAVNLSFVAFSKFHGNLEGQIGVFFIMVVAAAEASVGLAIIISVFRAIVSVETSDSNELKL
ncbi:MAG: NADH-quinone oxidoreductase subunit NuoK [Deltaproteobacteria bacterium]|nr:NADH-quinone oxidoreductase subunit NuoK [Deltaproteobacteria bacterium]